MRVLGIDFGKVRIGVALSDPLRITAQPLKVINKGDDYSSDVIEIKKILEEYDGISEIVVGLPKSMSGEIKESAQLVLEFVDYLKANLPVKISTWDERLTTAQAQKSLIAAGLSRKKRKGVIDKSAAAIMLQGYLDAKGNG